MGMATILVMWQLTFGTNLPPPPPNLSILQMKFDIKWPSGSNMRGQKSTSTFDTYL